MENTKVLSQILKCTNKLIVSYEYRGNVKETESRAGSD